MTRERDLKGWLDANVIHHPEPISVVLSDFEVDWAELCGSFILSLDLVEIQPRIKFSLDSNGWMRFWMPMHHSPMGVPASYAMFELTDATNKAIYSALKEAFGGFRPLGLNKDIDKLITGSTPTLDRLLPDNPIHLIKTRLISNYKISVAV